MKTASSTMIALLVAASAASCVEPITFVPQQQQVIAFDFAPYADRGFLFTPEGYPGEYDSIGLINLVLWPEARLSEHDLTGISVPDDRYVQGRWIISRITTDQIVKAAYDKAAEMGADAIIRFHITPSYRDVTLDLTLTGYEVSGFAIKRK